MRSSGSEPVVGSSSTNRPIPLAVDRAGNLRLREQEVRMSMEKDDRDATEIASHDAWVMKNV